jgi:hypothetical protein
VGVLLFCANTNLLDVFPLGFLGDFMHHYKKYLVLAGIGAAMTAIGLKMFVKAKKEEKHHGMCFWK